MLKHTGVDIRWYPDGAVVTRMKANAGGYTLYQNIAHTSVCAMVGYTLQECAFR
jgi:hypothetical protein